ncbi:MAG TPA: hypothetical protein PKO06_11905 [Candidatus Ozemobacteraceae bacterium]|nr:hypothetical protein [Candidatus Ozemobacteraceae bacterium]
MTESAETGPVTPSAVAASAASAVSSPVCDTNVQTATTVVDAGTSAGGPPATSEGLIGQGLHRTYSDEELQTFIQSVAREIVSRGMSVPAVFALELMKPLSFISASSLTFMGPILETLIDPQKIEKMSCVLEDRNRVEALLVAIETLEQQK